MVCNDLILPFFISVFFHSVVWHALTGAHSGALIKLRPQKSSTLLLDFTMTAFLKLQTRTAGKSGAYWEHFDVVGGRTQSNMELLHSDRLSRSKWIFLEQQQQWQELKMELKNWETLTEELRTSYMEINYRILWFRDGAILRNIYESMARNSWSGSEKQWEVLEKTFLLTKLILKL